MNKISKSEFYDIINTDLKNKKVLIGRHFIFELTLNDNEDISIKKIPCMLKDIKFALCDYNNDFFLLENTSGFCKIYNYKNKIEIDRFNLRYEPYLNNVLLADEGFMFIDEEGDIQKFNIHTKKLEKDDLFPQKLSAIFKVMDGYFCISNHSSGEQKYSIVSKKSKKIESISIKGFLWLCKVSSSKKELLICLDQDKEEGVSEEIFSISNDLSLNHILSVDDYRKNEDGYFKSFSFSFDNKNIALLWNNCLRIVNLCNKMVIIEIYLSYASDVEWIDNTSFLIATWKGLFLENINQSQSVTQETVSVKT